MATDMTTDTIRISAVISAPPERIYAAWLDSEEHSAITHSTAGVEPWVGGRHSAWGGSIRGTTVELQPNRRIVQTWWASDFPPGAEESRVEVLFEPVPDGTLVTINHTGLPQGRGHRYEDGWKDFYLDNMKDYFLAHPSTPMREESPAPTGQTRMDLPAASTPGRAIATAVRGTGGERAASAKTAKKPARAKKPAAKRPAAKKKAARKPVARKVARKVAKKAKARPKRKPVKARKPARKPARKAARSKAPKARKSGGRAKSRRGR
jgi:uncharacterized protein YndB with AHSA1/START domain